MELQVAAISALESKTERNDAVEIGKELLSTIGLKCGLPCLALLPLFLWLKIVTG